MTEPVEPEPGRVESAVHRDLERLGALDVGVRGALSEVALVLARAIDNGRDEPASTIAKLAQELRVTLASLTEVKGDDDPVEQFVAGLSAAVRDAAQSGAGDARRGRGQGGAAAR